VFSIVKPALGCPSEGSASIWARMKLLGDNLKQQNENRRSERECRVSGLAGFNVALSN